MNIKQLDAMSAYSQATKQMQTGLGSRTGEDGMTDQSAFSALITESLSDVSAATKNVEAQSVGALIGKADLVDVATAVQNAEMVVQTVVSVRDKVVRAYNDILKMPI
jgi:flagellar hook-basal body complex protein FliE